MTENSRGNFFILFVVIVTLFGSVLADGGFGSVTIAPRAPLFSTIQHAFLNYTAYLSYLDGIYDYLGQSGKNVSDRCRIETQQLMDYAINGDASALKLLDSVGMPSSGILEGGAFFLGFYSECVNTVVNTEGDSPLYGEYCLINMNFSSPNHEKIVPQASWLVLTQGQKPATIAVCIPSSCSEKDLSFAVTKSSQDYLEDMQNTVATCHRNPTGFSKDAGAVSVLCIFLIFLIIAVIATAVDFLKEKQKEICKGIDSSVSVSREALCEMQATKPNCTNTAMQCLLAFSFRINAKKIFTVESGGDNIRALHGLKFLSMTLIILGHTFSFATQNVFFRNPGAAVKAPKDFVSQLFANGTLAVDTFYFVSGLLVGFVTLKVLKKTNGKLPIFSFYFHRYFRLTPLMMAVVFFCAFALRYLGSGPIWLPAIQMYDVWCRENGLLNIVYLHNFINTEHMCLSHTWYLATDMQFYIVAPLMLIPLHWSWKYGLTSMSIFLLATTLATAIITALNHYPAIPYINNILPLELVNEYYKNVYIKPYCRMGPYIIGIAVGYYILHEKELILKKHVVAALWFLSVVVGLTDIYLMWPANQGYLPTDAQAAAYSSLARTVWAICLAWLTLACYYGYGGFINSILSWSPLVPMSRLTYSAYLIHPVVMNAYYGSLQTVADFSVINLLYMFLGNFWVTYILSVLLSLLFESPFIGLEKALFSKSKSS